MKRRFVIYGLLGWCIEVFWTGLGSLFRGNITLPGGTYIWMFPIYGLAVILEPIHNRMRNRNIFLRGGIYLIFIYAIEYIGGLILRCLLGVCPWNYEKGISIGGLIRLDYAPAWFVAGLFFEKIHDKLMEIDSYLQGRTLKRTS